jgi:hypothetical protein
MNESVVHVLTLIRIRSLSSVYQVHEQPDLESRDFKSGCKLAGMRVYKCAGSTFKVSRELGTWTAVLDIGVVELKKTNELVSK